MIYKDQFFWLLLYDDESFWFCPFQVTCLWFTATANKFSRAVECRRSTVTQTDFAVRTSLMLVNWAFKVHWVLLPPDSCHCHEHMWSHVPVTAHRPAASVRCSVCLSVCLHFPLWTNFTLQDFLVLDKVGWEHKHVSQSGLESVACCDFCRLTSRVRSICSSAVHYITQKKRLYVTVLCWLSVPGQSSSPSGHLRLSALLPVITRWTDSKHIRCAIQKK